MPDDRSSQPKVQALRAAGVLNPRPHGVRSPLFREDGFFDPRDLVQVKYEMLRRVRDEKESVSQASASHGFSRPSFYQAQRSFEREGVAGLVPKKRGPRGAHKLTDEVLQFVEQEGQADATLTPVDLVERIERHFGLEVHPRSLERALERRRKKKPP